MWGITELKVLCVDSQGRKLIKGQLTDSSMSLKWKRDTVICWSIFHILVNISLLNICPFKKKKKEFRAFEMHNFILLRNFSLVSFHLTGRKGKKLGRHAANWTLSCCLYFLSDSSTFPQSWSLYVVLFALLNERILCVCLSHNAPGYILVRLILQTVLLAVVSPGQD